MVPQREKQPYYILLLLTAGSLLFCLAGFYVIDRHHRHIAIRTERANAELVAAIVDNARRAYGEVLHELRQHYPLTTHHDHKNKMGVIPHPATFSIELAKSVSNDDHKVWMYSEHPFPWRQYTAVPQNGHEADALARLTATPDRPYSAIIDGAGGGKRHFYAQAVVLNQAACVECHNGHPASAKRDWAVGDTLAVLATESRLAQRGDYALLLGLAALASMSAIGMMLYLGQNRARLVGECQGRTDALTHIPNRASLNEEMARRFRHHQRRQKTFGVMMVDIDDFTAINDKFGRAVGDECLVAVAATLSSQLRIKADYLARWGGEEFVILLDDIDEAEALRIAERVRLAVADGAVTRQQLALTLSIGLCVARPGQVRSPRAMLDIADRDLMHAKASGKNRVVFSNLNAEYYCVMTPFVSGGDASEPLRRD